LERFKYRKEAKQITQHTATTANGIYHFYTFDISFDNLSGKHRLKVEATIDSDKSVYYSAWLCILPEHEKLTLLQYRNSGLIGQISG
jgi:hypothetical protein